MGNHSSACLAYGFASKEESISEIEIDGEEVYLTDFLEKHVVSGVYVSSHCTYDYPFVYMRTRKFTACQGDVEIIPDLSLEITNEDTRKLLESVDRIKSIHPKTYLKLTDNGRNLQPYWFLVSSYG